jgi:hypothetical protein
MIVVQTLQIGIDHNKQYSILSVMIARGQRTFVISIKNNNIPTAGFR